MKRSSSLLAILAFAVAGCSSEPADEPAAPPPNGEAGVGKFQSSAEGAGAGANGGEASPFRQGK